MIRKLFSRRTRKCIHKSAKKTTVLKKTSKFDALDSYEFAWSIQIEARNKEIFTYIIFHEQIKRCDSHIQHPISKRTQTQHCAYILYILYYICIIIRQEMISSSIVFACFELVAMSFLVCLCVDFDLFDLSKRMQFNQLCMQSFLLIGKIVDWDDFNRTLPTMRSSCMISIFNSHFNN